ncbi:MAG: response regulator [Calditrichae bacterium]|nr:response regulator [Calditrichota bacterium]MCB9058249.1 response regulator [Calditrichia bacterium]
MNSLVNNLNVCNSLILIADDNAIEQQILTRIIKSEGINTISCSNGAQVVTLAKEKLPDLILMDIMMPHMNGYEACKKLKQCLQTTDIPVIFLTSKMEIEDKHKGFEAGGVDYVIKPFDRTELTMRIKTHLKLKKAMDKLSSYNKWLENMINTEITSDNLKEFQEIE